MLGRVDLVWVMGGLELRYGRGAEKGWSAWEGRPLRGWGTREGKCGRGVPGMDVETVSVEGLGLG